MSRSLFVCGVMVQGPWKARSYIAAHDKNGLADRQTTAKGKLRVITRMLPFNVLAKTACWPPCLASIVISSSRRSKQNPRKITLGCATKQRGRAAETRTPQRWANSNRRRDSRLEGARQGLHSFPLSSSTLPSNEQREERNPLVSPLTCSTPPTTHPPSRRAGTCSWDIPPMTDLITSSLREREQSAESTEGEKKRGAQERAGLIIMPA